jgi:hypothetical protein
MLVLDLPGTLSEKIEKYATSPQGLYILSGESLNVGVLPYLVDDTSVGIFTSPYELFAEDSLSTLVGVGVTIEHPEQFLISTEGMVGIVLSAEPNYKISGDNPEAGFYNILLKIAIFDSKAIEYIRQGNNELSAGYDAEIVAEEGTWHGSPYSYVKKNIRYNHLAIVAKGTARNGITSKLLVDNKQCKDFNAFKIIDSKKVSNLAHIKDSATITEDINLPKIKPMKTINLPSGKSVEVSDESYTDLHFYLEDTKKTIADLTATKSAKEKEVESITQALTDSKSTLEATKKEVEKGKDSFGKNIAIATKAEKFGIKIDYDNFDALTVMRKVLKDKYPNTDTLPLETVEYLFSITEFVAPEPEVTTPATQATTPATTATTTQATDSKVSNKPKSAMSQVIDASSGNVIKENDEDISADAMAEIMAKKRRTVVKK